MYITRIAITINDYKIAKSLKNDKENKQGDIETSFFHVNIQPHGTSHVTLCMCSFT